MLCCQKSMELTRVLNTGGHAREHALDLAENQKRVLLDLQCLTRYNGIFHSLISWQLLVSFTFWLDMKRYVK